MNAARGYSMAVLWLLLLPFSIWGAHFLAAYTVTAIFCAKSIDAAAAIVTVRWIVTGITVGALAALGAAVWYGRGRFRAGASARSRGEGEARFVWAVLLMMSALSALAVLYVAGVVFFFGDCR